MAGKMIVDFIQDKISVALCTYNGELYLREQIESIFKQTRLPDEIIVCDDCSVDSTLKILSEFSKNFPVLFKIYVNKKNLGVSKNFEKAISLCSGDIIFLSDQDDVWLPKKIEKIIEVFNNNKDYCYIFSDAYITDKNLYFLEYTMWESISFNRFQRKKFMQGQQLEVLLKYNVFVGATMAFRSELRKSVLPIPEICTHDEYIALIGSIVGRGYFIEKPLIYHRQHAHNVTGTGKKLKVIDKLKRSLSVGSSNCLLEKQKYEILNDIVLKLSGRINNKIRDKISFLQQRIKIYERSGFLGLLIIICELFSGRYFKYSNGLESAAKDSFVFLKNLISEGQEER